jgi:Bardet-Biedl syndrome 2 protein
LSGDKDHDKASHVKGGGGEEGGVGGGGGSRDSLFVGTQSSVLAYDVQRNADVFFREVPDGVNALAAGRLGSMNPLVFAGGNCSVLGFDKAGAEAFWTVTGDNVTALTICDVNSDGLNELVVGSEDFEIRVFENEELISEQTEADKITHLCSLDKTVFCYGLANGSIGVYSGPKNRLWRVKTKHDVRAVQTYDLNADGYPEVISGWSNGALNVRNISNGETMYKHQMGAPVASIVCGDYRRDDKEELIVCLESGEVRGFLPADFELLPTDLDGGGYGTGSSPKGKRTEMSGDQKVLGELQQMKQELQQELHALEKSFKSVSSKEAQPGVLPAKTHIVFSLMADPARQAVLLNVEVSTDVLITNVVVIDLGEWLVD